jgi:hypothetical protein
LEVQATFDELAACHPRLLWREMSAAAAVVLLPHWKRRSLLIRFETERLPGLAGDELVLKVDAPPIPEDEIERVRRTYEAPRLVELAAIATCGLALYQGGGHEIVDIAARGTQADYLVDAERHPLEIAGRSHKSDLAAVWADKQARLRRRTRSGFYVCVFEFETPRGKLGSFPQDRGY